MMLCGLRIQLCGEGSRCRRNAELGRFWRDRATAESELLIATPQGLACSQSHMLAWLNLFTHSSRIGIGDVVIREGCTWNPPWQQRRLFSILSIEGSLGWWLAPRAATHIQLYRSPGSSGWEATAGGFCFSPVAGNHATKRWQSCGRRRWCV